MNSETFKVAGFTGEVEYFGPAAIIRITGRDGEVVKTFITMAKGAGLKCQDAMADLVRARR